MSTNGGYHCAEKGNSGNERIKILLVYPKVGSEAKNVSLYLPLPLLYLSSYLKDYSVAIFDQRVDDVNKFDSQLSQSPVCVGFSIMTGMQIKFALELAQLVKDKSITTVFGGVHPTILPEQTQKDKRVDYVVAGEGELVFRRLIETLRNKKKIHPVIIGENIDLDKSPIIPYELVDIENYIHTAGIAGVSLPFMVSRGCPFECTFCCNPVISKRRWRAMSVAVAIKQLDYLVNKFKLDGVSFFDENLTGNLQILNELAKRINGRFKWSAQTRANSLLNYDLDFLEKMGAIRFGCGLESGSPKILEKIKKRETVNEYVEVNRRLAKTDINVWYNYIIGYPDESLEDLKLTIRLAMQMLDENPKASNNTFYLLVPYPGTEIAETHLKREMPNSLERWADFGRHNFAASWHHPGKLELYFRIYFSSKFVGRRILRLFPDNADARELMEILSHKWRNFEFHNDEEWEKLITWGWEVLRKLFGESAY